MKKLDYLTYAILVLLTIMIGLVLVLSRTEIVPSAWNPLKDLDINSDITWATKWQMKRAFASKEACINALKNAGVKVKALDDFTDMNDKRCGISDRVELINLGAVAIKPLDLNCEAALRLVMWSAHVARPLARETMGSDIAKLDHMGSYNCREMRTINGNTGKMSKHATARAVDISGFVLKDGTRISVQKNWEQNKLGAFLSEAHDGACDWFGVVLGPNYNALHKDHFHFDLGDWKICR